MLTSGTECWAISIFWASVSMFHLVCTIFSTSSNWSTNTTTLEKHCHRATAIHVLITSLTFLYNTPVAPVSLIYLDPFCFLSTVDRVDRTW